MLKITRFINLGGIKNLTMSKTRFFSLVAVLFLFNVVFSQNTKKISGKSSLQNFNMAVNYEHGVPPDLYCDLDFSDENGNGILEAEEKAVLKVVIKNKGKGVAQDLKINVLEEFAADRALKIDGERNINFLYPDQSVDFNLSIEAGFYIKSAEHKFKISVMEAFGYDMDPAYLLLNTLEYQAPQLAFAGYKVIDVGKNTMAIQPDGQLQLGEQVQLQISLQNRGQSVAKNVHYKVVSKDNNIYLQETEGELGDIRINEVKNFWFGVSPNKRINPNAALPLYLTLSLDKEIGGIKDFQMPIYPNQNPPKPEILEVKAKIDELQEHISRFEVNSNKFTTNIANVKDIRKVPVATSRRAHSLGVIFGIEYYKELAPAPYAENDAMIMKDYFKNLLGVKEVVVYTSEEAVGLIFDNVFNPDYGDLQKAIIKGETDVFVFYSGHGVPSKDGEQVYLFPSTGRLARIDLEGYNINKFYENLEKLGARSINVFLDACFSGESRFSENHQKENLVSMKGIKVKPKLNKPWEADSTFSVFSSSSFDETSCVFEPSQTGLFTYYLCAGLSGDADLNGDRKITMGELYRYVKDEVQETSKKISSGTQTPEFHGDSDLVLVEL